MSHLVGESACLAAAFAWASAVLVFRRPIADHGAPAVNLFKCLLASALLALTMVAMGVGFAGATTRDMILVAISGVIGLTVGDTALFAAVGRIGAHRTLLLQTLAPVFAAALALPLGERLSVGQLTGAVVILCGVALVVAPGRGAPTSATQAVPTAGVLLAILAAFGQGAGVVVAKSGLDSLTVLPSTLIRLAAGAGGLLVVESLRGTLGRMVEASTTRASLLRLVPATLVGTYLAMLLMMAGVAMAPASVAAVLLATTPVFGLFLEWIVDRKPPPIAGFVGTGIAILGVALLTFGG
jgi:drug/metabolite transporter (DMT)-like permease